MHGAQAGNYVVDFGIVGHFQIETVGVQASARVFCQKEIYNNSIVVAETRLLACEVYDLLIHFLTVQWPFSRLA